MVPPMVPPMVLACASHLWGWREKQLITYYL